MTDRWTKIKVICSDAKRIKDCNGCGMNTIKDGVMWQLDQRIPCTNAAGGICKFVQVNNQ